MALGGHGVGEVVRVEVAGAVAQRLRAGVVGVARTSASARSMPTVTALDLGAVATARAAWARTRRASGMPMSATACWAATAVASTAGSARPTSSAAWTAMRRAM